MRNDKQKALKLRLTGKSYGEIQTILKVPKSTLSGWFFNLALSGSIRDKIEKRGRKKSIAALISHNKQQTPLAVARARETRQNAASAIKDLSKNELLVLGIALYWAEGYKRPIVRNGREATYHVVSLTNSDPFLVKTFLKFLREYCEVAEQKIKASIRIFQHQNEQFLLRYWQQQTRIPFQNFKKTYYGISKSSLGKRPFNRLPYGTIQIVVADTQLFHRIMGYIEGLKKIV